MPIVAARLSSFRVSSIFSALAAKIRDVHCLGLR